MKSRTGRFRFRLKKGQARFLRILGYPLFGFFVFLSAFYLSLPLDRIKDRLERELSQDSGPAAPGSAGLGIGTGMDVSIGQLDLHVLPLGASLRHITLRPRRTASAASASGAASGEQAPAPKPMYVDDVTLSTSYSTLLGLRQALGVEVSAIGGSIDSFASNSSSDGAVLRLDMNHLELTRAPLLGQFLPLPLGGTLTVKLDMQVPALKAPAPPGRDAAPKPRHGSSPPLDYSKATGLFEIKLEQGTLGDGKAKLAVPGDPFLSQGLTFPRLSLGNFTGRVVVERGRATLGDVRARSTDVEIWIDGYIELRDPLPLSELRLYLRFQPSAALTQREPAFELLNNAMSIGKRSDGALGFAITGTIAMPRSRPAKEPPEGISARPGSLGQVGKEAAPPLRPAAPALRPVPPPGTSPPMVPLPSSASHYVPPGSALPPPGPPSMNLPPPPPPPPVLSSPPPNLPAAAGNTVPPPALGNPPPPVSAAAAPAVPVGGTAPHSGPVNNGLESPHGATVLPAPAAVAPDSAPEKTASPSENSTE